MIIFLLIVVLILWALTETGLKFYELYKEDDRRESTPDNSLFEDPLSGAVKNIAHWHNQVDSSIKKTFPKPQYGIGWYLKHQPDCDEMKGVKNCTCTPTKEKF